MSVLIKGMDLPESCDKCKLRSGSFRTMCNVLNTYIDVGTRSDPKENRDDRCPLVEITTPHGRLIDVDALLIKAKQKLEKDKLEYEPNSVERFVLELTYQIFVDSLAEQEAPVVLEAEV